MVVLLDINDGGAGRADCRSRGSSGGSRSEADRAEIGERDEASILLIVLDDPLGVLLAQRR